MSAELLTLEDVEAMLDGKRGVKALSSGATIKAACERVVEAELCPTCHGNTEIFTGREEDGTAITELCRPCTGTGRAHYAWQDAFLTLGQP